MTIEKNDYETVAAELGWVRAVTPRQKVSNLLELAAQQYGYEEEAQMYILRYAQQVIGCGGQVLLDEVRHLMQRCDELQLERPGGTRRWDYRRAEVE